MDLKSAQECWDRLGRMNPISSMLPADARGTLQDIDQLFVHGQREIDDLMTYINSLDINLNREKALDFGCGLGRLTQALANYFDEVCGIDIAPSFIELANKHNRHVDKCKYVLNQTDDLSRFANNSIDFIYSRGTLHSVEPHYCKSYLNDFLRILTPKGLVIFQLAAEPARTMKGLIFRIAPISLLNLYRKAKYGFELYGMKQKDVVKLIEQAGGTMLDIREDHTPGDNWISFRYCVLK